MVKGRGMGLALTNWRIDVAACPSCGNQLHRLGYYLESWSLVPCQRCGEYAEAEKWFNARATDTKTIDEEAA